MTDCNNIPTIALIEESKKNMDTTNEFIKSGAPVMVDQYGDTRDTLAGTEQTAKSTIAEYKLKKLGNYADGPHTLTDGFEYVIYNGNAFFAVSPSYETNPTTYPDPNLDPNLVLDNSYATREFTINNANAGDSQLAGGKIWPVDNRAAVIGDTGLVDVIFLKASPTLLYSVGREVSGDITALNFAAKTATIGGEQVKLTAYSDRIESWGGGRGVSIDNTPALIAAASAGVKKIILPTGLVCFSQLDIDNTIASALTGVEIVGQGGGYAYTAQTVIAPIGTQDYIFNSPAGVSGMDALVFTDVRFDCMKVCKRALNQLSGAAWETRGNCSFFNHTEWAWYSEQGLNKYGRLYVSSVYDAGGGNMTHATGGGIFAYSDFWADELECYGGSVPLRVAAGGGRIGKLLANNGLVTASLHLEALDSSTNLINTAIESAYLGETGNESGTTVPIIRGQNVGDRRVRQVQITNLHLVHGGVSRNTKMGGMLLRGCDDWTVSNVAMLGQWTFATSQRFTNYFVDAQDCNEIQFHSGIVRGVNKHPMVINQCDSVKIGSGLSFVDWAGPIATTANERAAIWVVDGSKVQICDGVSFSIKTGDADAYAASINNGNSADIGTLNIEYANGTIVNFTQNPASYGYKRTGGGKRTQVDYRINDCVISKGTNNAKHNYEQGGTGVTSISGGVTGNLFTLSNQAEDQAYIVTVQQQGNAANKAVAIIAAADATCSASTFVGSTGNALDLTFIANGLSIDLQVGSGYGQTSWLWTRFRMG